MMRLKNRGLFMFVSTKKIFFVVLCFLCYFSVSYSECEFSGCIPLNYLDTIVCKVPATLVICQGRQDCYRISGDDKVLRQIKVSIFPGGDLKIEPKDLDLNQSSIQGLTIYVTVKNLQKLELSKHTVTNLRNLTMDKLIVHLGRDCVLRGQIKVANLYLDAKAGTHVMLKGTATRQNIEIRGDITYEAKQLKSSSIYLDIHGDGHLSVYATNKLAATVTGNAEVLVYGNPKRFDQKVFGKGFVRKTQ